MGVLESLVALLDSLGPDNVVVGSDNRIYNGDEVDVDTTDIEPKVCEGPNDHKIAIREDVIEIYPDELQGEEYARFRRLVRSVKSDEGSIKRSKEFEQTRAIESAWADSIDETVDFFDGLISDRDLSLLRSCLYLRQVAENDVGYPDFDVHEEKRELRERYGLEAYYVAPLASSGYFDASRHFRNLYHDFEQSADVPERAFREEFELLIGEKLLAIFVSEADDTDDVMSDFRSTAAKQLRHQPRTDFVDVCGVGRTCRETIDGFVDQFREEYPEAEFENRDRSGERVIRIYPGTLTGTGF